MGYDSGTAAGLMAGAFTESTVIGTAGNTISRLDLPEAEKTRLLNNIPVAYAVSYLVGTGFVVWFLSSLAPKLLRVDLRAESRALEARLEAGSKTESGTTSAYREWDQRAYRIRDSLAGRTVAEFEASFAPARVFVQRIRRGGDLIAGAPAEIFRRGDIVVAAGRRHVLLAEGSPFGEEVEDRELLDFPMAVLDVVITRREMEDRTLAELAEHGRGVILVKLVRAGEEIPFTPGTVVNRGDVLRLAGAASDVERAAKVLGYAERPSSETDVVFVGLGILLGGLVGAITLHGRRLAVEPHRQRGRAHHGPRLRLAALRASHVRPHPGARALGLRYDRSCRVHRRRRPERGAELRGRAALHRAEPAARRASSWP